MKKSLLLLLLLLLVGAGIAYKMYNKPHADLSQAKADVTLDATALFTEFSEGEEAANTKYLNKVIDVKGTVTEVKAGEVTTVALQTNDDMGGVVAAEISPTAAAKAATLQAGSSVTVRGTCSGFLQDVVLQNAVIVE